MSEAKRYSQDRLSDPTFQVALNHEEYLNRTRALCRIQSQEFHQGQVGKVTKWAKEKILNSRILGRLGVVAVSLLAPILLTNASVASGQNLDNGNPAIVRHDPGADGGAGGSPGGDMQAAVDNGGIVATDNGNPMVTTIMR